MPPDLDFEVLADAIASRLAAQPLGDQRRWLLIPEAAAYTGLSPDSICTMLASGRLTAYRPVSGRILIDRRQLDSTILASTGKPRRGRGIRRKGGGA